MKVLKPLVLSFLLIALLVVFSACGGEPTPSPTPTPGGDTGDVGGGDTPAHTHTPGEWVVDVEPTKTTDGSKHTECTDCGETIEEIIFAIGSQGLAYEVNEDGATCTITGIGTCTDTEIYFPGEIDGYAVTRIGDYAFEDGSLTKIVIPGCITEIGEGAFCCCDKLEIIEIHEGVTSIGDFAFVAESGTTSIIIPDSVTHFGKSIFAERGFEDGWHAKYDNAYYIGTTSNPFLFLVKAINYDITSCGIHEKTQFINDFAFCRCDSLTSITIPNSVTSIGEGAFYTCRNLNSVTIGSSVASIGEGAFSFCNITSITIPDSVTSIGDSAFWGCRNLTNVTLGSGVTSIGLHAFSNHPYYTNVTYNGTKAQWETIEKDAEWLDEPNDPFTATLTIHCTDGDITITYHHNYVVTNT